MVDSNGFFCLVLPVNPCLSSSITTVVADMACNIVGPRDKPLDGRGNLETVVGGGRRAVILFEWLEDCLNNYK